MVCKNCGSYNDDSAKFCIGCGSVLAEQQATSNEPVNAEYSEPANTTFNGEYNNSTYTAQPVTPDQPATVPGKGLGIASMVCGIVSFFCAGIVLGILAIIFGGVSKSKGYKGGMATAGIVCGVIGLVLTIIFFIIDIGGALLPSFF